MPARTTTSHLIKIIPYTRFSKSARLLRKHLPANILPGVGTGGDIMDSIKILWGNSVVPSSGVQGVMNTSQQIHYCKNKGVFAEFMSTRSRAALVPASLRATIPSPKVQKFFDNYCKEGRPIVGRTLLSASQGRGIHLFNSYEEYTNSGLSIRMFSEYFPKSQEYRVHVGVPFPAVLPDRAQYRNRLTRYLNPDANDRVSYMSGYDTVDFAIPYEIISVSKKGTPQGKFAELTDTQRKIRSHNNGWVFLRKEVRDVPAAVIDVAIKAVKDIGLEFGAVDVGYTKDGTAKVFEINTAPGIEGQTLEAYTDFFRRAQDNYTQYLRGELNAI